MSHVSLSLSFSICPDYLDLVVLDAAHFNRYTGCDVPSEQRNVRGGKDEKILVHFETAVIGDMSSIRNCMGVV